MPAAGRLFVPLNLRFAESFSYADGALIVGGSNNQSLIRFNSNSSNNYLNADGPKYAGGTGGWSVWYLYEVVLDD